MQYKIKKILKKKCYLYTIQYTGKINMAVKELLIVPI